MPTIPKKIRTNSSDVVLNAIRNSASINYQNYVPIATPNADSIREIGAVIMDDPQLQNTFLNALVNRIVKIVITSKTYQNPWATFKKGILDFGEKIEEIFIDLINSKEYDIEKSESELFKRENPNVYSAFHIMNFTRFYKVTIERNQLRKAFLSWDSMDNFIQEIISKVYTSAEYDEFLVMKYMLAKSAIQGNVYHITLPETTKENIVDNVATIKSYINKLQFMSADYNIAKVRTLTEPDNQYIILTADFDAKMTTEVLASAFNMTMAEFKTHRVLVDSFSFSQTELERLKELFTDRNGVLDPTFMQFTPNQLNSLKTIPCFQVDKDFFQIYDALLEMGDVKNVEGLYWNYVYHTWKYFSISPFANALYYSSEDASVDRIELTSSEVFAVANQEVIPPTHTLHIIQGTMANRELVYSIESGNEFVKSFNENTGVLTTSDNFTTGNSITVKIAVADKPTVTTTFTIKYPTTE